jgi:hypothetical protein
MSSGRSGFRLLAACTPCLCAKRSARRASSEPSHGATLTMDQGQYLLLVYLSL